MLHVCCVPGPADPGDDSKEGETVPSSGRGLKLKETNVKKKKILKTKPCES